MLKGEAKQYPPGNIRWGIGPAIVGSGGVEVSKTIEWVERRKPVVQRVVVQINLLETGTRFVRPLTVNHRMGEWGYHKTRRVDVRSIHDDRCGEE